MLSHLPEKLAKIRRKNRSRFQIVGIKRHVKTPVIAGFPSSEFKNYRTDVISNSEKSKRVSERSFRTHEGIAHSGVWRSAAIMIVIAFRLIYRHLAPKTWLEWAS